METLYGILRLMYTPYMSSLEKKDTARIIKAVRLQYGVKDKPTSKSRKPTINSSPPPNKHTEKVTPPQRKRKWFKRLIFLSLLGALLSGGIFSHKVISAGNKISTAERSVLGQIKDLLFGRGTYLAGEDNGRINILIIAIGGEGHKGENLADTIMVASIDPVNNRAALLSIPRDLYVEMPNKGYRSKINSIHAYAEAEKIDSGPAVLRQSVEEITGLDIHYYARGDFIAFKELVDAVGGINITINRGFYDYWHKISFPAGTEKMNGERALAYVRARYIEGPEGGDFKRAARQQQVLLALRDKGFSIQTAFDFSRLNGILNSLADNIRTNLELWEMKRLYEIGRLIDSSQVSSTVLTSGPKDVLVGDTEILSGLPASILKPRTGNFTEIQNIARHMLNINPSPTTQPELTQTANDTPPSPSPSPVPADIAKPSLEIRNGTNTAGMAKRAADKLAAEGYTVKNIGNAISRNTTTTAIYLVNQDAKENAIPLTEYLQLPLNDTPPPAEPSSTADILLILGQEL
jgi:polyisoprenyl-teichoic acid--peptidoglycan teichoic acid transferase